MNPNAQCTCGKTGGCEICNTVHLASTYDPTVQLTSPIVYALDNLTRRERFAMAAMQGLLAFHGQVEPEWVVKNARHYADAMIAELDKEEK